jgi:antitoxin VapB
MPTSPQARVTVNPFPARSRSTACRITCGLTNFGLTGRSTPPCPTRLGQRLLQLRILRLELPQPTRVGYCHPGVLGLPGCSTSARRSRICATALWSSPSLSLPQHPDDCSSVYRFAFMVRSHAGDSTPIRYQLGVSLQLNIRDPKRRGARERARQADGETKTEAVPRALRERLQRIRGTRARRRLADELDEIALHCSALPVRDPRSAINLSYDQHALPR